VVVICGTYVFSYFVVNCIIIVVIIIYEAAFVMLNLFYSIPSSHISHWEVKAVEHASNPVYTTPKFLPIIVSRK
jgi:hypothetical protein